MASNRPFGTDLSGKVVSGFSETLEVVLHYRSLSVLMDMGGNVGTSPLQ